MYDYLAEIKRLEARIDALEVALAEITSRGGISFRSETFCDCEGECWG